MSPTWHSEELPKYPEVGIAGRFRVAWRGALLLVVLLTGVVGTLLLRLLERALHRASRPWTGWITVWVCRLSLLCLGLRVEIKGRPMEANGILVANHSSWLDIFVLNSVAPLYFVAKVEVASWPGIGWLARLTGTVFVRRDAREAGRQAALLEERILAGHRLLFFPEGTSTDGQRVLPFKPTLFAPVFSQHLREVTSVEPVTVAYEAPVGYDPRFYGWWGDMEFGPHFLHMLAAADRGRVTVTWHAPLRVSAHKDRKEIAKAAEAAVRSTHPHGSPATV